MLAPGVLGGRRAPLPTGRPGGAARFPDLSPTPRAPCPAPGTPRGGRGSRAQGTAVKAVPYGSQTPRVQPGPPSDPTAPASRRHSVPEAQPTAALSSRTRADRPTCLRTWASQAGPRAPRSKLRPGATARAQWVQAKDTGLRGPQMGLGRAPAGPARAHGARCSDTSIHPSRDVGVQLSGPTRGAEGGLPGRRGWGQQGPRSRRAGPGPRVREIPAQRRVARPQALGLRPTAPRSPWRRQSRRSSLERQACGPVLGRSCLTAPALGFSPDPPARLAKRMTSARIPQAPSSPALPGSPGLSVEQAFLGAGAPLSHLCLPGGSRPWDEPAPPAGSRAPRPPKPISRLPSQRPSGLGRLGHDTLGDLGPGLPACTRGGDCRGPLGTK